MFLPTFKQMQSIRDGLIAKYQTIDIDFIMVQHLSRTYPHLWKYAKKTIKELDLSFDKSQRKWRATHKQGHFSKPIVFEKKPSQSILILHTLWRISKECSNNNPRFQTVC